MDAKTRYRRRLKLQDTLTRVLMQLAQMSEDKIPPDVPAAHMATQVVLRLGNFIAEAGVELPDEPDLSRFLDRLKAQKREAARKAR